MKIVCESCGAKYSIADEKVAGKVFKIRCKKCSAVIVVKGDSPDAGDESTRVYDQSSEAIWHVVVAGEQQGPFSPRQIGEMLADAKIDWEAYVWREGMDGWQPAKDVEGLVSSVMADGGKTGTPKSATAAQGASGQVFGGSSDMGADPFAASDDGGLGSVINQPARSGDDLFAKSARSPFSGAGGDEEEARPSASQASARTSSADAMTGQRNENSVLFSLSNLQALATGSGGAPVTSAARPGMAAGEGSGLIDIRALASATQTVADKPNGSSREKVEDLLSVGSGAAGFSATHFAAPVAVEKADNSKLLLGGMFAAIMLLGGAVAYLAMREPPAQAGLVAAANVAPGQVGAAPAAMQAAATPTPEAAKPNAADPGAAADERDRDEDQPRERDKEAKSGSHSGSSKKTSGRESGKSGDKEAAPAMAAAPEPAPAKKSGGDQSIDDLLSGALGGKAKPAAAAAKPAASESLPSSPSRDDVLGALKSVAPKVAGCGNGQSGIATAKIGVAGPTGRVTSVDVSGQFAGTPVAACVAREAGKAKFPRFSQPSFSVTFPFKI